MALLRTGKGPRVPDKNQTDSSNNKTSSHNSGRPSPREHHAPGKNQGIFFLLTTFSKKGCCPQSSAKEAANQRHWLPSDRAGSPYPPSRPHPPATLCPSAPGPALSAGNTAPRSLCMASSILVGGREAVGCPAPMVFPNTAALGLCTRQRTCPPT